MSNNEHLVSIGMPVYNSEQRIRQALDSVLAQDYMNFELIISDNASTDGTQTICLQYAAMDKRIRYHRNERNMGMNWNMNRLRELASGEYFKWAGSHDVIAPSFISTCKKVLDTNPQVVLAYPLAQARNEKGETMESITPEIIDTRGLPSFVRVFIIIAKGQNYAVLNYGLYRSSALRRCRPLTAVIGNDQLLLMEISVLGAIALVPDVLFFRRYFGPVLPDAERVATDLIRGNPAARNLEKVRPIWALAKQNVLGAWRLASLSGKVFLVPLVAYAFYSRWHKQLKDELRHPYTLRKYTVPDY